MASSQLAQNQPKKSVQYRMSYVTANHRKKVRVNLETPVEEILKVVEFDTVFFTPHIVEKILEEALAESKKGNCPRTWDFEFIRLKIDDPDGTEYNIIQELSEDVKKGNAVVEKVQSLSEFLDPQFLTASLASELSNKKLTVLSPVEVIFLAYEGKLRGQDIYMPAFDVEGHLEKYGHENGPKFEVLSGNVPVIKFPTRVGKLLKRDKISVKGYFLGMAELNVRLKRNSYFFYKIGSTHLS